MHCFVELVCSKWDSLYEPFNIVENVLKNNDSTYKALNPVLDFTLFKGVLCFIAGLRVESGEPTAGNIEVFTSETLDQWEHLMTHRSSKDAVQVINFNEEIYAKYLRLNFLDNIRGGNLCTVRFVQVIGLPV